MAGQEYQLPLTPEGSVAAPDGTFDLTLPSADSKTYLDIGRVNAVEIPEFGWALADGVNPLRLVTRGAVYNASAIAPKTAPTLSITGAGRATVVGTYTGQPGDGESVLLGRSGASTVVTFKSTLVTNGTLGAQVKIGATDDITYTNFQKLVQGTGTQNVEYHNDLTYLGVEDDWQIVYKVEVSALDTGAGTITYRYVDYGSVGNTCNSTEVVAVANFSFASATFTGGSDGTGTAPSSGTRRYFFTWGNSVTGGETGRSPISEITKDTNANIDVALSDCADTDFDLIHVYGTAKGGVEFYPAATVASGTATATIDISDDDLVLGAAWNDLLYRAYAEGMPPRGRALAWWKGAIWSLGLHKHADYTRERVSVTNGSDTVTFEKQGTTNIQKGVTEFMVNREFQVTGTTETYTILSVSESAATAVLDRNYEGSTDGDASYTIRDVEDASRLSRCVQGLYSQWPVDESPGRVDGDDAKGGTALLATKARLFAFTKTTVTSVTGEDLDSWDMNKIADGIGCVAPSMVVGVEGGGMFLSPDAFYAISPDETIIPISSPKTPKRGLAQGIDGTVARINLDHCDSGYSVYDPTDRIVIFGVPLDDATTPNYEIVFDLQNGCFSLYKRGEWVSRAQATLPDGTLSHIAGDINGHLWQVDIGESDGFYGSEAVHTVSSATTNTITVSGTPFSTSGTGEEGKPVIILYADGSTVNYAKVASNTSSVLTLTERLATVPAANDQIVIGGIAWQAKSGFTTMGEEFRKKWLRSVTVRFAPTTRGDYYLSTAVDDGDFRLPPTGAASGDLATSSGKIRHRIQWPGETHAINFRGFKPGGQAILRGGVLDVVMRQNGAV